MTSLIELTPGSAAGHYTALLPMAPSKKATKEKKKVFASASEQILLYFLALPASSWQVGRGNWHASFGSGG